jgi:hypothetical protein
MNTLSKHTHTHIYIQKRIEMITVVRSEKAGKAKQSSTTPHHTTPHHIIPYHTT